MRLGGEMRSLVVAAVAAAIAACSTPYGSAEGSPLPTDAGIHESVGSIDGGSSRLDAGRDADADTAANGRDTFCAQHQDAILCDGFESGLGRWAAQGQGVVVSLPGLGTEPNVFGAFIDGQTVSSTSLTKSFDAPVHLRVRTKILLQSVTSSTFDTSTALVQVGLVAAEQITISASKGTNGFDLVVQIGTGSPTSVMTVSAETPHELVIDVLRDAQAKATVAIDNEALSAGVLDSSAASMLRIGAWRSGSAVVYYDDVLVTAVNQ